MQIPLLSGVYTDSIGNVRQSYPVNLVPVPKQSGVSAGYFRAADGIVGKATIATGKKDRGAINWRSTAGVDRVIRLMGDRVYQVAYSGSLIGSPVGAALTQPDPDGGAQCTFDYGFDYLALAANGKLFLIPQDLSTVTQVTDADLGTVLDVVFIDGYYITTDGEFIVVTDLNDPFSVNPLKYGSAEIDPDPIVGLFKVRNELAVLGRHTIEFFDNVGGSGFPFQRIEGAQIQRGVIGTHCAANFMDTIAFLGSGRNEAPSVWMVSNGTAARIATQEIDYILAQYTEAQLAEVVMETRVDKGHQWLMIHLPDRCIVYDGAASQVMQQPVWFTLTSASTGFSTYRAKNLCWAFDRWVVGDPVDNGGVGYLTDQNASHYGSTVRHELQTLMAYNESRGAIVHSLELVSTTYGAGTVNTSQSVDGLTWSANAPSSTAKRIQWRRTGSIREWRIQRFQWDSGTRIVPMRLEAVIEPLAY